MGPSIGLLKAVVLGLVQGLTEFLPVSSSGHLVIVKSLLKVGETGITLEVITHLATMLAVVIYLRKRIVSLIRALCLWIARGFRVASDADRRELRLLSWLVVGTLPAGIIGFAVRGYVERLFKDVPTTAAMLVVTGIFLLVTGRVTRQGTNLGFRQALSIGVAQAIAIVPGLSRSGLTVGTGLAVGVDRREAVEFSLLLSIPAVVGANLLEAVRGEIGGPVLPVLVAAAVALVAGYAAISLLFRAVIRNRFHLFGYYLIPFGLLVILIARLT